MRFLFVFFSAIVLLFAAASEGQGRVCQPGAVFNVLCNTCRCNRLGTDMACTRKQCSPDFNGFLDPYRKKICQPGTYFRTGCNDCMCNYDGTNAACTMRGCPQP